MSEAKKKKAGELVKIQRAFKEAVQDRYHNNYIENIEIENMNKDNNELKRRGWDWEVRGIITLKNGSKKRVRTGIYFTGDISGYGVLKEFEEEEIEKELREKKQQVCPKL